MLNRMNKIKTIIFDFDGVIHDTFELNLKVSCEFEKRNISRNEYKDYFNGNLFSHKNLKQTSDDGHNDFYNMIKGGYSLLKIEKEIEKELYLLSEKYNLHIISSNRESILKDYLHLHNLKEIFKEILGFETHKSKVEKFKILLERYNLNKDESIFITDTLGDILEANKVGIKTIAVDFGFHERERLERGNPFKIISSFNDIRKIIFKP